MKASRGLSTKSTFFAIIGLVVLAIALRSPAASAKDHAKLQPGFDNEFRFSNSFDVQGKIAFTASINGFDRILVLDLNKKRIETLIDGPGNNSYPRWSPSGDKLVFTSDRDKNDEIYLADADGSNQIRLTSNTLIDDNADWMPDGKSIVYMAEMPKSGKSLHTNLFSLDIESRQSKKLTDFSGKNSTPSVSPKGNFIAYTTNRFWPGWDVCIFDLRNGKNRCPLAGTTTYCRPAWSPLGKQIAYSSGLFTSIDPHILTVSSGASVDLPSTSGNDYDLSWSKDAKYLIFSSDMQKKDIYNIYITKLDDPSAKEPAILLGGPYSLRYPSWHQEEANP